MTIASVWFWRAGAAAALGGPLAVAAVATDDFYRLLLKPCPESLCATFEQPTPETIDLLGRAGVAVTTYATWVTVLAWGLLLLYAVVAAALLWLRPAGGLAVLTATFLAVSAVGSFTPTATYVISQALTPPLLGLFPNGKWWPGWWRWAWPGLSVVMVVAAIRETSFDDPVAETVALVLGIAVFAIPITRYFRLADWTARQQMKWMLVAVVLLTANVCVAVVADVQGWIGEAQPVLVGVAYLALAMIPASIGLALFRYKLYGVDVVLRRTVRYSAAIVGLLVGYSLVVAAASLLMARTSASAVGALLVAALALGGGLVAARTRTWTRRRLLGPGGVPGSLLDAALAALSGPRGSDDDRVRSTETNLAEAIATTLDLPYAAVLDARDRPIWTHGVPTDEVRREPVVDATGTAQGAIALGLPAGARKLGRFERRTLREILPYVLLVLRVEGEAERLREARATAATAREDERRRLRRDLHDGVGPLLASQLIALDSLRLAGRRDAAPAGLLAHMEGQTRSAIAEIRRIARDLRPAVLDAGGLPAALEAEARRFTVAGLPVTLDVNLPAGVSAAAEVAVLRIMQEALANAARHAAATRCLVVVTVDDGVVDVLVEDDGRGPGDSTGNGIGTASMRHRAQELGGTLEIGPGPSGMGTRVRARIPL